MESERIDAVEVVRQLTRQRGAEEAPVYTLRDKTITGKLDLKHRTIEVAVDIQHCDFLGEVDLRYCEFKQAVYFADCQFRERFNSGDEIESHTVYHKDLNCRRSVFEGPFDFNGGVVEGSAYFSKAEFLNEEKSIDLSWTSIGEGVEFQETFFKGETYFSNFKCGGVAFFEGATFEGEASFGHASLDSVLQCRVATFKAMADFNSLKCGGVAFFEGATFEGEAKFGHASLDGNLQCQRTTFEGEADFGYATIGKNLYFNNATFAKPVDLQAVSVSRALWIEGASFWGDIDLYQSKIGILNVGDTHSDNLPFKEHSQLNLRECRFDAFYGEPEVAKALAKKQRPEKFSRDPYLQLEKYYRGAGNELEAKRIHYTGRNELRKNALRSGPRATKWDWFTRWSDWWVKWLTGYGVRTGQLLIPIVILLLVGTFLVFWDNDALLPASGQEQVASNKVQVSEAYRLSTQPKQAQEQRSLGQHLFDRSVYCLDLFLPVVNLHVDEKWEPNGLGRQIYAVFHSMVGWILVPLLLASLSGIIRRE